MYNLNHLQKTAWINVLGGMLTLVAGIISQIFIGFPWDRVLVTNLIYYVLVAIGWFIMNQLVMATTFKKLANPTELRSLLRHSEEQRANPPGKWGLSYIQLEMGIVLLWLISVVGSQFILQQFLVLPAGGFIGGYLVGNGLGKLRFVGKVKAEELKQQRQFYFSDNWISNRTIISYYSTNPEEQPLTAAIEAEQARRVGLPPGVKRRAVINSEITPKK